MQKHIVWIVLFSLVVSFFISCQSADEVARVDDIKITAEDFKDALEKQFSKKENYSELDIKQKLTVLDQMLLRKLKLKAAYEAGLDEDPEFKQDYEMRRAKWMTNMYWRETAVKEVFPEKLLRETYDRKKTEVKASHVLIAWKGARNSDSDRTKEEALTLAEDIAAQARAGEDFYELAYTKSDDKSAPQNKGNLGWFSWGDMDPAFEDAAYALEPGEISGPVESSYGYHVILVQEKRPNASYKGGAFEEEEGELQRALFLKFPEKQKEITKAWEEHIQAKKQEAGFEINKENVDAFQKINIALADSAGLALENYRPDEMNMALATWSGGELTVDEYFKYHDNRVSTLRSLLTSAVNLEKDVDGFATVDFVVDLAVNAGLDNARDIRESLDHYKESTLIKKIEEERIKDNVSYSEDELKEYYANNKPEFTIPATLELWEVYVENKNEADRIYDLAKSGKSIQYLAVQYSKDNLTKNKNGFVGKVQETQRGDVSREAFKVGENKLFGPVQFKEGWVIGKTGEMTDPIIKSYEKVYSTLQRKVGYQKTRELTDEWEKQLRETYTVEVDTQKVAEI